MKLTSEEIDAAKTANGGWSRNTLARWNVPWPPPQGWRQALIKGERIPGGGLDERPSSASGARGGRPHQVKSVEAVSLEAFIGSQGCLTSRIKSDAELVDVALKTFGFDGALDRGLSVAEAQKLVKDLSKNGRRVRAKAAVQKHWPDACDLWPAHAKARN